MITITTFTINVRHNMLLSEEYKLNLYYLCVITGRTSRVRRVTGSNPGKAWTQIPKSVTVVHWDPNYRVPFLRNSWPQIVTKIHIVLS